jgi:hypothetical protein
VGATSKRTCGHSQIRWTAIGATPWTWVTGIVVLTQFYGQPLSHAAIVGAVGAISGLITWAIYHAISRRDDGIIIFAFALSAATRDHSSVKQAVVAVIATGLATLSVALVFLLLGKSLRIVFSPLIRALFRKARADNSHATHSPLSDPEVDPILTR